MAIASVGLLSKQPDGPQFRISIEGDRVVGISNMDIFCFDLTLFKLVGKRLGGPGFLLHDTIFLTGWSYADRRCVGALGQQATSTTTQYIVTMNSAF